MANQRIFTASRKELEYLYNEKGMSSRQIGDLYGFSDVTVLARMKKLGVPSRTAGPKMDIAKKSDLKRMYLNEHMTLQEIADYYGSTPYLVKENLKRAGVDIRTRYESMKLRNRSSEKILKTTPEKKTSAPARATSEWIYNQYAVKGKTKHSLIKDTGYTKDQLDKILYSFKKEDFENASKKDLRRMYLNENMSTRAIGLYYGVCASTVVKKMNEYGIERRKSAVIMIDSKTAYKKGSKDKFEEDRAKVKVGKYIDKEWLIEHYVTKGLSLLSCAELFGCTSYYIRKSLQFYGIPVNKNKKERTVSKIDNVVQFPKDNEKTGKLGFFRSYSKKFRDIVSKVMF